MYIYYTISHKSREKTEEEVPLKIIDMKILKQNSGIDISKDFFVASCTFLNQELKIEHKKVRQFDNTSTGFEQYYNWINKHKEESFPMNFTMEATGVYYESLAYFLYEKQEYVSVLLPIKAKKYIESFNIKSKTDKIDAKLLGQMGVERVLPQWQLSSKIYRRLRTLSRERQRLVENRTVIKNQLHAEKHSEFSEKKTITRLQNHIKFLDKQIDSVEKDIEKIVDKDSELSKKINNILTIPGVGLITAVSVISETQGFDNFTSLRQLTSYAGYDIKIIESGKYVGKTRISKKGNSHIRRALYMPSISVKKYSSTYNKLYNRLLDKKDVKLVALTAIQRKLLGLIYTLWKNDAEFEDNYQSKAA